MRNNEHSREPCRTFLLAGTLVIAIFIIDLLTPVGHAVWIAYLVPVVIATPAASPSSVLFFPAVSGVLIVLRLFLAPPGGGVSKTLIDRAFGLLILWAASFLLAKHRKTGGALHNGTDLAIKLENSVLRSAGQLQETKELSNALVRIDMIINSRLDMDEIMKSVVAEAALATGCESSLIAEREEGGWKIRYAYNFPLETAGSTFSSKDTPFAEIAAETKRPVVLNDAHNDPRANRAAQEKYGIRSVTVVPLVIKGKTLGALFLNFHSSAVVFTETQIDFADKLASLVSLSLENARLFEEHRKSDEALRKSEEELKKSQEISRARFALLQAVYATAPVGLCFVDNTFRCIHVNRKLAEISGLTVEEQIGKTIRDVVPEMAETIEANYRRILETGKPVEDVEMRCTMRSQPGRERFWLASHYPVKDPVGRVFGINTVVQEITERKRMEEEIRYQAHHDDLTDLPNRKLFIEILGIDLAEARRHRKRLAILFLDLDRFKEINDTLGHAAGDQLLIEVAGRLRHTIREADTVARVGGDEFSILISDFANIEDINIIARKTLNSFLQPYVIAGHELHVTTSIGISIYPDDSEEKEALLKYADIAMYHAKEIGKNNYQFYNPDINIRSIERMRLENRLRQTLEREELVVYYQPQVNLGTSRITGAEALVRWRHPELGLLSPAQFIPVAEETGFIVSLDEWVLRIACMQAKSWQETGYPPTRVTVNLSTRQFQQANFVEKVSSILKETELEPDFLEIEITENTAMQNIERTVANLSKLNEMGVSFSIDDFGTGYSSLNHLKKLPLQKLKIDKSFIRGLGEDLNDQAIVNAVIAMAHNMNLQVVAEGVETREQLSFLQGNNCDGMQGFLFSEPLPAAEMRELLCSQSGLP